MPFTTEESKLFARLFRYAAAGAALLVVLAGACVFR